MNKLSVIIISWNAKHFLEKCLKSLYGKNKDFDFELIFIDNNSTDGTGQYVNQIYPQINYIFNNENRGVAPARNQGFKIANGDYLLILDVDTEFISENSLSILFDFMEANPRVGLIGAQLISSDGEIQKSCLKFPSIWIKLLVRFEKFSFIKKLRIIKEYYMDGCNHNEPLEVDYVIGAFQFIRKKLLDEIGLYDEKIFYGPEDIDFCLRVKRHGYKVVYYPHVKLYHFYQRITKKILTRITYKHLRGLMYFFWKHKYINYPKL